MPGHILATYDREKLTGASNDGGIPTRSSSADRRAAATIDDKAREALL